MIGCIAEADTTNINMDNEEMTERSSGSTAPRF